MQKLVRCFLNTDMRCQHDGLAEVANNEKVDVHNLKKGEHIVFINTKRNRVKMISPGGVLSYLRLAKGQVDLETLKLIPEAFTDGDLELAYSNSLKKLIKKKMGN